jgi:hypothetical protein
VHSEGDAFFVAFGRAGDAVAAAVAAQARARSWALATGRRGTGAHGSPHRRGSCLARRLCGP